MKTNTLIAITIVGCVIIANILYGHFKSRIVSEIKANIRFAEGSVYEVQVRNFKGPKNMYVKYSYQVNGVTTEGETLSSLKVESGWTREQLMYRQFPVVYSSKDPNKSDMLIVHDDSVKYGLAQ